MAGCWTNIELQGISILSEASLDERRKTLLIRVAKELVLNKLRLDRALDCI